MSDETRMCNEMIAVASVNAPNLSTELVDEAFRLIRADVHEASPRPCETCRKITSIIHGPFWCLRAAIARAVSGEPKTT